MTWNSLMIIQQQRQYLERCNTALAVTGRSIGMN